MLDYLPRTDNRQVQHNTTGQIFEDTCDIFLSASGILNDWKWPTIPGLETFKGKLLHSAKWDEEYDYSVCPGAKTLEVSLTLTRTKG